jgi:hypothetical protein
MTPDQVRRTWGNGFGRCRGCRNETWYFNYAPFSPEGAGVQFRRGRVEGIFTLWSPGGWRTSRGLRIGDLEARVTALHSPLRPGDCGSYRALLGRRGRTVSAFYLVGDRVWGFALLRFPASPCL